jgi:hypothetical protein
LVVKIYQWIGGVGTLEGCLERKEILESGCYMVLALQVGSFIQ